MTSITQAPELMNSETLTIPENNTINNNYDKINQSHNSSLNHGGTVHYYNLNIHKYKCLGITIIGQTTPEGHNVGIYCGGITPNSAAYEFVNFIDIGDRVVSIDGENIKALSNDEAVQFLQFKVNEVLVNRNEENKFVELGVLKFPEAYTEDEDFRQIRNTEITSETYTTYSESQSTLNGVLEPQNHQNQNLNLRDPRIYNSNYQNLQKTNTWINNHRSSFHELNRANSVAGSPNCRKNNSSTENYQNNMIMAKEATLCKNTKLSEFRQQIRERRQNQNHHVNYKDYVPQPIEFSLEASFHSNNINNERNTSGNISDFSGKSVRSVKNSNNSVTFSDQYIEPIEKARLQRTEYNKNITNLSIDTPMRSVIKLINNPLSNLKIKDRNWLRVVIKNSFLGADLVDWLHENVVGLEDRRDAKTYAATLFQGQMVRGTVQARRDRFSEKSLYCF